MDNDEHCRLFLIYAVNELGRSEIKYSSKLRPAEQTDWTITNEYLVLNPQYSSANHVCDDVHSRNERWASVIDWVKVLHLARHKIGLLEMLFPANLLTSTEKTKSKPGETTTGIYNKPRLTWITKFTTTQNNHASGTQKYYNSKLNWNKLNPGLVTSYDLRLGNGAGLCREVGK